MQFVLIRPNDDFLWENLPLVLDAVRENIVNLMLVMERDFMLLYCSSIS